MSKTITNTSNQPVTIVLDHPAFHNSDSGWRRASAKFANQNADGSRTISDVRRSYPGTIRVGAKESVSGLHPAIEQCAQVITLKARKVLVVTEDKPASDEETV